MVRGARVTTSGEGELGANGVSRKTYATNGPISPVYLPSFPQRTYGGLQTGTVLPAWAR